MNQTTTYFTTGEFAKLCHVSKDTLFYYDEIDLLKPELIKENGYRYYSFSQYFLMDLICILKESGTSLREIKKYIREKSPEQYITLLKEKQIQLRQEQEKLEKMQDSILCSIEQTEKGLHSNNKNPYIALCKEEYFIATPLNSSYSEKSYLKCLTEHMQYCEEHNLNIDFSIGGILNLDMVLQKRYLDVSFVSSKILTRIDCSRLYIKPKGMYAMIEHYGFYHSLSDSYIKLMEYIDKNQFQIIGNSYENDLINYLCTDREEDYIVQIAIEINV